MSAAFVHRRCEFDEPSDTAAAVGARHRGRGGRAGNETSIEVRTVLPHPRSGGQRVTVQSDTGKTYVLVVVEDLVHGMCSCPEWIFRGSRAARERGWAHGLRLPCKHLVTVHAATVWGRLPTGVAPKGRFALLEFEE